MSKRPSRGCSPWDAIRHIERWREDWTIFQRVRNLLVLSDLSIPHISTKNLDIPTNPFILPCYMQSKTGKPTLYREESKGAQGDNYGWMVFRVPDEIWGKEKDHAAHHVTASRSVLSDLRFVYSESFFTTSTFTPLRFNSMHLSLNPSPWISLYMLAGPLKETKVNSGGFQQRPGTTTRASKTHPALPRLVSEDSPQDNCIRPAY